jgi:uncharacterized protein YjdB
VEGLSAGDTYVHVTLADNQAVSTTVLVHVSATANLELTQTALVVYKNDTYTLGVQGNTSVTFRWRSTNPDVAGIDDSGIITGRSEGESIITAYDKDSGDAIGSCRVTVESKIRGISLQTTQLTVGQSSSFTIGATVQRVDTSSSQDIEWETSNDQVVAIVLDSHSNFSGFRAVGLGTALLTARAVGDRTKSATLNVQVTAPTTVTGITIFPKQATLLKGTTVTCVATVEPSQAVTWRSSNTSIATVDSDGLVTAMGVGTASITVAASGDSSKTVTASITVTEPEISEVVASPRSVEMSLNQVQILAASVFPAEANQSVTWTVVDNTIAELDTRTSRPRITARKPGRTQVRATSTISSTSFGLMDVVVKTPSVTAINLNSSTATVYQGETVQLSASLSPVLADQRVTWRSLDEVYASVSSTGKVTGKANGSVQIEAKSVSDPTMTARATVTILPVQVNSVSMVGNASMTVGDTSTYSATVTTTPARSSTVTWKSLNDHIIRVNSTTGRAVAVAPGVTTVRASSVADDTKVSNKTVSAILPGSSGFVDFTVFDRAYWAPNVGQTASGRAVFLTQSELNSIKNNQNSTADQSWISDINDVGNYYLVIYGDETASNQYLFIKSIEYSKSGNSLTVTIVSVSDPQYPADQVSLPNHSYVRIVLQLPRITLPIGHTINTNTAVIYKLI